MLCLLLRLHAKLPTIYQYEVGRILCFDERGVENRDIRLIGDFKNRNFEDEQTRVWALVDSNEELKGVSQLYSTCGVFVVQAASPSDSRLRWSRKLSSCGKVFILELWSLPELICG